MNKKLGMLALGLLLAGPVAAQNELQYVLESIERNNLTLQAEHYASQGRTYEARMGNSLEPLSVAYESVGEGGLPVGQAGELEISQEFALPMLYAARNRKARTLASQYEAEYLALRQQTLLEAKEIYLELCALQAIVAVNRPRMQAAEHLARLYETRYQTGDATLIDKNRAEFEELLLRESLSTVDLRIIELERRLTKFAGDLLRMYTKYIESKGWKYEITSFSEGAAGGYKEVVMKVTGQNVYGTLKYESGVHRVQRVPQTETQGRVHTSAASVAVLPEAEEFDVEISMNDIRKDIFCASGPGGQSVNTTYSAIRLTHIPTGIVVQCQDQKSQLKNFDKAFAELRTRVFNLEYSKYLDEIASKRKTMVSTGDRSAKIRTYNYPQGRITDHRINYTIYNLSAFMDGDIQDCIDHLIVAENAERLKESEL